jgi:hypothetical protein
VNEPGGVAGAVLLGVDSVAAGDAFSATDALALAGGDARSERHAAAAQAKATTRGRDRSIGLRIEQEDGRSAGIFRFQELAGRFFQTKKSFDLPSSF